jgi:integrase
MGYIKRLSNGFWQLQLQRKGLLDKRVYLTYETHEEAERYNQHAEACFEKGVIPPELSGPATTLNRMVDEYEVTCELSQSDLSLLPVLVKDVGKTKLVEIDYAWVERWVNRMKDAPLAPSTITKRVGLLARIVDWGMRRNKLSLAANPVKLLPKGYASKKRLGTGEWFGARDRRLETAEEGALRSVITEKNELLLLEMALETGMRLREMYTLTRGQIDLPQSTIFLDKTKNGDKRQVPVTSVLQKKLEAHLKELEGDFVFPWWSGETDRKTLENVSQKLSHRFAYRVRQAAKERAEVSGLRFHDLRHEATSRFFERTQLTDTEIASITGHKDPRMLKRYANLRGSTLAKKLW